MDSNKNYQLDLDLDGHTIDLSSMDTMIISGLSDPYITTSSGWSDTLSIGSVQPRNTIQVNGEGADIVVNGESVMDTLRGIQERLNILRPNPELEAEWDELRELGQQYRELEAKLAEKSKMWNTLKQMPPPEIE